MPNSPTPSTTYQIPPTKIAIVHDWLLGGGAERVVLELHKLYPEAPIYTSYCTPEWRQKLDGKVVTGYLQKWPFNKLRKYVGALRIFWFRNLNLSDFDVVISSTGNGEAKHIQVPKTTKNICYCHSPTHFYWRHYDKYQRSPGFGIFNPLARIGLKLLVGPLRKSDYGAAQKVDYFIANSNHIKSDIKRFYGRDSLVIHPPVDIARFAQHISKKRHGFVTVGRQTPYKHTDILVEACSKLNLPLLCVGNGPEHKRLIELAGPSVTFQTNLNDDQVAQVVGNAEAFLFAAHEDFGVAPVEALAAGTPVIAYEAGGALDFIKDGQNGLFFEHQNVESLSKTLKEFGRHKFDADIVSKSAEKFSPENFDKKITSFVAGLNL